MAIQDRLAAKSSGAGHERSSITTWGLPEAGIAWITSTFIGSALFVLAIQSGGFSTLTSDNIGGHFGQAAGQLASGQELSSNAVPVALQLSLLFPGWILLLGTAWVIAAVLKRDRPGWSLRGKWTDVPLGVFTGLVLQVPILTIVVLLMELIFGEIEPTGRAQALVDGASSSNLVLVLLIVCVAIGAPIVEELFYRGLVQPALIRATNVPVGIGIASLIFGAVHFALVELIPLSVVGLAFGLLAHRTGRLVPAIVAHITFNAFTLSALLFGLA